MEISFGTQSTATQAKGNASSTSAVQTDSEGNVFLAQQDNQDYKHLLFQNQLNFPLKFLRQELNVKLMVKL